MTLLAIIASAVLAAQASGPSAPLDKVGRLDGDWSCGRDMFDSCGGMGQTQIRIADGVVTAVAGRSAPWTPGTVVARLDPDGDLRDSSTLPSSWRGRETVYFSGRLMTERSGAWSLVSTDIAVQLTYWGDQSRPYDSISFRGTHFYRKTW